MIGRKERTRSLERDLWVPQEAAPVRFRDRVVLAALTTGGGVAVLVLVDWWFRAEHVGQPALYFLLSLAFWYGIGRVVLGWINYLGIKGPGQKPPTEGLRVAIFTTSSPGEPLSMFEKTLAACRQIRYPHTTYLLDDTEDQRFREVAERNGAVWLELVGLPGAKAGKINRALELTDEDFILVLDPDHIPFPEFLDHVIGHFDDEKVGFVQVCQAYYNQSRSFVAKGAAEQTYAFYGPGLMGLFGHGASLAIGANCTFRRSALESIGGHGIGLAEDLVTAIRLHAAGWHSVYVPRVVSRGLVPEDLGSFYRQQLKWSRGVHEVAFVELPRAFRSLTWRQRLSYLTISTYFLSGATTLIYFILPYLYLWTGIQPTAMRFAGFLTAATPVALAGVAIYLFAQRWLCHPKVEKGLHWRGLMMKVACWPVFLAGTVFAVIRVAVPYIPTAKEAVRGRFFRLAWPHVFLTALYVATLVRVVFVRLNTPEAMLELTSEATWSMVGFASMSLLMITGGIYAGWEARRPPIGMPWESVDVGQLSEVVH